MEGSRLARSTRCLTRAARFGALAIALAVVLAGCGRGAAPSGSGRSGTGGIAATGTPEGSAPGSGDAGGSGTESTGGGQGGGETAASGRDLVYCAAGTSKDVVAVIGWARDVKKGQWPAKRPLRFLALKPDGGELWATAVNWDVRKGAVTGPLSVMDPDSGKTIAEVRCPDAGRLAFSPDGSKLYVPLVNGDEVAVFDPSTRRERSRFKAGKHPFCVALTFDGSRAFVGHTAAVVGASEQVRGLKLPIAIPRLEPGDDFVAVVDTTRDVMVRRVALGGFSAGVAVSPDGRLVLATVSSADVSGLSTGKMAAKPGAWDGVAVIDAKTSKVLKRIAFPKGSAPKALAFTPDGGKAYTICGATDSATPIDVATYTLGKPIPLDLGG